MGLLHQEHHSLLHWHPFSSYQGYQKYLSAVQCSGKESRLIDCPHSLAGSGSVATLQCSTYTSRKYIIILCYMNKITILFPPTDWHSRANAQNIQHYIYMISKSMTHVLYCHATHTHSKGLLMLTINMATQFKCQRFCRLHSSLTFLQQLCAILVLGIVCGVYFT